MKCPPKLIATGDYRKILEETAEQKTVTFTDKYICAPEDAAKQNSVTKSQRVSLKNSNHEQLKNELSPLRKKSDNLDTLDANKNSTLNLPADQDRAESMKSAA